MKFFLPVLIMLLALSCEREAKQPEGSSVRHRRVKSVMESAHNPIRGSNPVEGEQDVAENSEINQKNYGPGGELTSRRVFNSHGSLQQKTIFDYDKKGNCTEVRIYNLDGSINSHRVNFFDALNMPAGSVERDGLGIMTSKQVVQDISDGNKLITTYSVINYGLHKISEQVVDKSGRVAEDRQFTNEKLTQEEFNQYDTAGNLQVTVSHNPVTDKEIVRHFKYDSLGRVVEAVVLEDNLVVSRDVMRYNRQNDLLETITFGVMGRATRRVGHSYMYDEEGNKTKDITFLNGKPQSVRIFKIEYY